MTWPPDQFYWSVIQLPGWRKTGQVPPALLYELQHDVPLAVENLHAVCMPLAGGKILVCAAPRDRLAQLEATTLTLTPSGFPAFLLHEQGSEGNPPNEDMTVVQFPSGLPEASQLNLLVGEFEATPIRRARQRRHGLRMAATLLCSILAWIGLERRADLLTRHVAISGDGLDAGTPNSNALNPVQLANQLAFLSQLHVAVGKVPVASDSGATLAALLRSWPTHTDAVPQVVSITQSMITMSISAPSEPSQFLRSFQPPGGWRLEEPRVSAGKDSSRVMLEMHPLKSVARIP